MKVQWCSTHLVVVVQRQKPALDSGGSMSRSKDTNLLPMQLSGDSPLLWPNRVQLVNRAEFEQFVNMMLVRVVQGQPRYGAPDRRKMYYDRAIRELKKYKVTGNMEQLINAANYCWLESVAPQNPNFHFDNTVRSVIRTEFRFSRIHEHQRRDTSE